MGDALRQARAGEGHAPHALRCDVRRNNLGFGPEPGRPGRGAGVVRGAVRRGDTRRPRLRRRYGKHEFSAEGTRGFDGRLSSWHVISDHARGLAAYLDAWRLAFAAPALAGGVLALLLARLPEPEGFTTEGREGPLVQVGRVFRRSWAVAVVGIAAIEGAVILGFLTFLAPSLEGMGFSPAVAGLAVGFYGLAVLGWTRAVKLSSNRLGAAALILIGGGMLALGYASGAVGHSLGSVGVAAVLVGGGFAFMHSTLQTWATEVVPEARATVISLFAAALVAGSGLATAAVAPLADEGRFGLLFAIAALVAVPLALFAALARKLYAGHQTYSVRHNH